jgi:probable rRNA maturation factor
VLDLDLSVRIEDAFAGMVSETWLRKVVGLSLSAAGVDSRVEMGLVVASDGTVRDLNRTYRGIDDTTDVLAFALTESRDSEVPPFVLPPDDTLHLGEIVVSYPRAEAQAEAIQHPLEQELALLVAHGVLHLLGHDHDSPEDERQMKALESKILDSIGAE